MVRVLSSVKVHAAVSSIAEKQCHTPQVFHELLVSKLVSNWFILSFVVKMLSSFINFISNILATYCLCWTLISICLHLKRYSGNKYLLLIKTNKLIAMKTFKRKIKTKGELNLFLIGQSAVLCYMSLT